MSWENLKEAYRTRLGNLPAKSVLVLMVDEANAAGLAILSVDRIVMLTEIKRRTVLRIVQLFGVMELAEKTEAYLNGELRPAFQVNLAMLGQDLRAPFKKAFAEAQRKVGSAKCLRDTGKTSVSETPNCVSEAQKSVSETQPPHPLNGVPLSSPVMPPGDAPEQPEPCGLDAEQTRHVEELRAKGRESDAAMWEAFYAEENAKAAHLAPDPQAEQARIAELRAAMPTAKAARAWVMRECGFVPSRRDRDLEEALEAVLLQDREAGIEFWTTGTAMAAAWKEYQANGWRLRILYGPVKFYRLSIWRDSRGWAWDQDALRDQKRGAEAKVGS